LKRLWIIGALLLLLTVLLSCGKEKDAPFRPGETPATITLAPQSPAGARLTLKTVMKDGVLTAESLTVLSPETVAGTVFRFDGGITATLGEVEIPLEIGAAASIGLLAEAFVMPEEDFTEETEGGLRVLCAEGDGFRITLYISRDSGLPTRVLVETADAQIDAAVVGLETAT